VAVMVREIMDAEIAQLAGAELGERAPERRSAQRNGYRGRRWDEASELFRQCLDLCPDDGPSSVMGERCRMMRDKSLPENWDGAFEHLVKA